MPAQSSAWLLGCYNPSLFRHAVMLDGQQHGVDQDGGQEHPVERT